MDTAEFDGMTDKEFAEEALKMARAARARAKQGFAIADKALAVVDECRESERNMVGAATLANMHFKQLTAVHFALHRALVVFVADLRERGEDYIADDLDKICSASMSSLEHSLLQKREAMN